MPATPTPPGERLLHVDVLRGLALFGVLVENLGHFVLPSYAMLAAAPDAGALDRAAFAAIRLLCDNKIYAIFSLLFGYGVALQMARAEVAGARFAGLHVWRMAVLFLIGVAHGLLWNGDILSTYALLGLLLLPLRRARDRSLIALAAFGFLLPTFAGAGLLAFAAHLDAAAFTRLQTEVALETYPLRQSAFAFGAFALGLAAGRRGLLARPDALLARTRRALLPVLALGLAFNLAALPLLYAPGQGSLSGWGVLLEALLAVATPTLAFAYLVATLRVARRPALAPLAAIGRTTLSNYLLQSFIGVGILARTGLGPLGEITPARGIALSVAIFALQVLVSRLWLARFAYGPAEWLWRATTYGRLPAWRRSERFSGP